MHANSSTSERLQNGENPQADCQPEKHPENNHQLMANPAFNCILLIDDDKVTNHLHSIIIRDLEIAEKVEVRHNGRDGLAFLQEAHQQGTPPQLVFVDLKMPVMDGFAFVDAYRQLPLPPHQTRIVMLTTSTSPKDISRMQEMGIEEYYEKPLTEEILRSLHQKFAGV